MAHQMHKGMLCGPIKIPKRLDFTLRTPIVDQIDNMPHYRTVSDKSDIGTNIYYRNYLAGRHFTHKEFIDFIEIELCRKCSESEINNITNCEVIFSTITDTFYVFDNYRDKPCHKTYQGIQSCDFNRKLYQNLLAKSTKRIEYIIILNHEFDKPKHHDVLDYAQNCNCSFAYERYSISWIGFPERKTNLCRRDCLSFH